MREVLEQLVPVVLGKPGRRAQSDPGRAGRRLRDQLRIDVDPDLVVDEEARDLLLQLDLQHFGRQHVVGLVLGQFAIELVGQFDEMTRGIGIAQIATRQTIARLAEQPHRMLGDGVGA